MVVSIGWFKIFTWEMIGNHQTSIYRWLALEFQAMLVWIWPIWFPLNWCWESCYQWISLQISLVFLPPILLLNLCIPTFWYLSFTSLKKYDLFNICRFLKEWWLGQIFFSTHPSKTTLSNWVIPKLSRAVPEKMTDPVDGHVFNLHRQSFLARQEGSNSCEKSAVVKNGEKKQSSFRARITTVVRTQQSWDLMTFGTCPKRKIDILMTPWKTTRNTFHTPFSSVIY